MLVVSPNRLAPTPPGVASSCLSVSCSSTYGNTGSTARTTNRTNNKRKQTAGDADEELAGNGGDVQHRTDGKKMQEAGGVIDDAGGPTVRPHICGIPSCGVG